MYREYKSERLSRYQGGFAVDFNGVKNLSKAQLKALNSLAKEHGLAPLMNQAADPSRFDTDPNKYWYDSLKEAANENEAHYDNIQNGKLKL